MYSKGYVEKGNIDTYRYGVEVFICNIADILIVSTAGLLSKHLIECFMFYVSMSSIRKRTGGLHASTFWRCKSILMIVML